MGILINKIKNYIKNYYNNRFTIVTLKYNEFKQYYNFIFYLIKLGIKFLLIFILFRIIFYNLFTVSLSILIILLYYKYILKILEPFRYRKRIKRKLKYFLRSNNLFTERVIETQYTNSQGEIIKETDKEVINSAIVGFNITNKYVIIRCYKKGDSYVDKLTNADTLLSSLLGLQLDNKENNINYCDYYFKRYKDTRIILNNNDLIYNNSTIIPLNNNLSWNILKQPHLLLAGVTGSGKTTFLNYLILEFKKMKADVYICDPKRSDLASLKHILGTDFVTSDVNNIAKITRIVKEQMETRFIEYKEDTNNFVYGASFVDYGLKPIFIVFDELGAFRASADKKVFAETMANLTEIVLKGREMGVFVVLSTQQPNANNIPTELRDNLSVRLAMGNMSSEAYRMVFGEDLKDLQGVKTVGSGYIFLDGLGWTVPTPFEAPYIDYANFNFVEQLKNYQKTCG